MTPETLERVPAHTRAGLKAMNADAPLAGQVKAILQRLETETIAQIATDHQVSQTAVYMQLLRNAPQEWQALQAAKSLQKLDKAESDLEAADDGVKVSRARELARLAMWHLERTCRPIYGDTQASGVSADQFADLLLAVSNRMLAEKQANALPHDNKAPE